MQTYSSKTICRSLCRAAAVLLLASSPLGPLAYAQDGTPERRGKAPARVAVSTNLPDYLYLVTPNVDAQVALNRNLTARAVFKYNGWSFRQGQENELKNRQMTIGAGARWWPWYTYSGWWLGAAMQYQEYDRGGLVMRASESGDAFGAALSGGYSLQVTPWLDLDFGIGFWGGYTLYTSYACPYCGRKTGEGGKFFVLPDEARIALMFIF